MSSESLDSAAYYVALEGVTRHGLAEAVKAIFKNALGHAFFPSPPELRGQIDKAMEHHVSMRNRVAVYQRMASERPRDLPRLTEEQRERQNERMARFHASYHKTDPAAELAAIRAKYDPALLAQIPDAPLPPNFKKIA